MVLAIHEACTDSFLHSGCDEPVEVRLGFEPPDLIVSVRDHGRACAVGSLETDRVPDRLGPLGRDLFMMARLMDEMELRRNGVLEVRMVKRAVLPDPVRPPLTDSLLDIESQTCDGHSDAPR